MAVEPKVAVKDLPKPQAVTVTVDGRIFVGCAEQKKGENDGKLFEIRDGKPEVFAEGIGDPISLATFANSLFICGRDSIRRVDLRSKKVAVWLEAKDLPEGTTGLSGLCIDERGTLIAATTNAQPTFLTVTARWQRDGSLNRGDIKAVKMEGEEGKGLSAPILDSQLHVLVGVSPNGIQRHNLVTKKFEQAIKTDSPVLAQCFDVFGRLYLLTADGLWGKPKAGEKPIALAKFKGIGSSLAYDPIRKMLLTPNAKDGTLLEVPAAIPGWEVDDTPLSLKAEVAFGKIKWTGWDSGEETGVPNPLRPLVLTHAGDGSKRIFVATQQGVIHSIESEVAKETKVFLDITSKVFYKDTENEQGLLGLAFHPKYKTNGEFYVFYTDKSKKLENVLSRFRVSKTEPNKADPDSEEELLRISHKHWNHDGGTVAFGPDGFLYLVLGDGGSANDPDDNGQSLNTLLGKILRIDVNAKGDKTPYAIPADNPFVSTKDARPEIFALGVRNPWRLAFDRKTGQGWFADVGQNLWEEINLLEKGANYGWRRREGNHPFAADGTGPKKELTEPIWEYHHDIGKSITGGTVYRGSKLPELEGYYLYADYVAGKHWALKYDEKAKRVVANRPILTTGPPIMSFGEDEDGEVYHMTYSANGKGIYRYIKK